MKKIIIIVALVIVVGIGAVIFFAIHKNISSNVGVSNVSGQLPTSTSVNADALVPVYHAPTSTTIVLGTSHGLVTMNNFYATALGADDQFIVMAENSNYEITYDTNANQFYLYIEQAPFDANRIQIETDFLSILGISQSDACRLNAEEGFPESASMGNAQIGLSFCGSNSAFQAR